MTDGAGSVSGEARRGNDSDDVVATHAVADVIAARSEVGGAVCWPGSLAALRDDALAHPGVRRFGEDQADLFRRLATSGSGGRRLIVSHGIIMELALLAALSWAEMPATEEVIAYCEGFDLRYDGDTCRLQTLLRLP